MKDGSVNSLHEEVDHYKCPSTLAAQIKKFMSYMADGEECQKTAYEEVDEACRAFEADQAVLQKK